MSVWTYRKFCFTKSWSKLHLCLFCKIPTMRDSIFIRKQLIYDTKYRVTTWFAASLRATLLQLVVCLSVVHQGSIAGCLWKRKTRTRILFILQSESINGSVYSVPRVRMHVAHFKGMTKKPILVSVHIKYPRANSLLTRVIQARRQRGGRRPISLDVDARARKENIRYQITAY